MSESLEVSPTESPATPENPAQIQSRYAALCIEMGDIEFKAMGIEKQLEGLAIKRSELQSRARDLGNELVRSEVYWKNASKETVDAQS